MSELSKVSRKAYTEEENLLAARINAAITGKDSVLRDCLLLQNEPLPREGETNRDGKQKCYYPDVLLFDQRSLLRFGVEAMGEGSKSDDFHRHQWLVEHGVIPLYFSNHEIKADMGLVMRTIRTRVQLGRLMLLG